MPPLELPRELPGRAGRGGQEQHARYGPVETVGHSQKSTRMPPAAKGDRTGCRLTEEPFPHERLDRRDSAGRLRRQPGRLGDGEHARGIVEDVEMHGGGGRTKLATGQG